MGFKEYLKCQKKREMGPTMGKNNMGNLASFDFDFFFFFETHWMG